LGYPSTLYCLIHKGRSLISVPPVQVFASDRADDDEPLARALFGEGILAEFRSWLE